MDASDSTCIVRRNKPDNYATSQNKVPKRKKPEFNINHCLSDHCSGEYEDIFGLLLVKCKDANHSRRLIDQIRSSSDRTCVQQPKRKRGGYTVKMPIQVEKEFYPEGMTLETSLYKTRALPEQESSDGLQTRIGIASVSRCLTPCKECIGEYTDTATGHYLIKCICNCHRLQPEKSFNYYKEENEDAVSRITR
jgi:hypothetical protein